MKNGSQQTTNVPVTIASVRAALRSRFCFCFSRPAADAASSDICSLFVDVGVRSSDLKWRPGEPFPVSSGNGVEPDGENGASGIEEGERRLLGEGVSEIPERLANSLTTLILPTARRIFNRLADGESVVGCSTTAAG